jgi:hypothetical protein
MVAARLVQALDIPSQMPILAGHQKATRGLPKCRSTSTSQADSTSIGHLSPSQCRLLCQGTQEMAVASMCLIAFYFLLHIPEYTTHHKDANTRMVQFRAKDIMFWDLDLCVIPNDESLKTLYTAHSASMQIDNQKNGTQGGTIHHDALQSKCCPIRALTRQVHLIMNLPNGTKDNIISTNFMSNRETQVLKLTDITKAVKLGVSTTGLVANGFPLTSISLHSLQAGGAMAMHLLNHINHDNICKMGYWSSDTFLIYIHEQITAFFSGLYQRGGCHCQKIPPTIKILLLKKIFTDLKINLLI